MSWVRALMLVALCSSCETPKPTQDTDPAASSPPAEPVALLLDGCARVVDRTRCQRGGDQPLRVWLPGTWSQSALSVEHLHRPIEIEATHHEGGALLTIASVRPGRYVVRDRAERIAGFSVEPTPWTHGLLRRAAKKLNRAEVADDETDRMLDGLAAMLGPSAAQQRLCLGATLAYVREHWAAVLRYADALAERDRLGDDDKCAAVAQIQAAQVSIERLPDGARARRYLERIRAGAPSLTIATYADYFAGVLARSHGELDDAIEWFQRALTSAVVVGNTAAANDYRAQQVLLLSQLGRYEEAMVVAEQMVSPSHRHRANVVWSRILQRDEDPSLPSNYEAAVASVDGLADKPDASPYHNALVNLAVSHFQDGNYEQALETAARVDLGKVKLEGVVIARATQARAAATLGRVEEARAWLDEAQQLSEAGRDPTLTLRAMLVRAQVEDTLGDPDAALAHYARADQLEERLAVGITPQAGRSMFARTWRRSRARRIALLLERGETDTALCVVLGSRARYLRSLRAQAGQRGAEFERQRKALAFERSRLAQALRDQLQGAWKLSAQERAQVELDAQRKRKELDALSDRFVALAEGSRSQRPWDCAQVRTEDPDRTLVTMHPGERAGHWWFFVDRAGHVEVRSFEVPADVDATARGEFITAALKQVAEVGPALVVVPLGGFAEAELRSDVLGELGIETAAFSLGLGTAEVSPLDAAPRGVVARGRGQDLRTASEEAALVQEHLSGAGWTIADAWQRESVDDRPTLLHYAGHASHSGINGWRSTLSLGDRELSVGDLISLQAPPPIVVLGACDAAAIDPHALDGGMNIATSFLLAGSQAVIAPTVQVDDAVAFRFAQWLYSKETIAPTPQALLMGLRRRVFAGSQHEPRFAAWRVLVP